MRPLVLATLLTLLSGCLVAEVGPLDPAEPPLERPGAPQEPDRPDGGVLAGEPDAGAHEPDGGDLKPCPAFQPAEGLASTTYPCRR